MQATLHYTLSYQQATPAQARLVSSLLTDLAQYPLPDYAKIKKLPATVTIDVVLVTAEKIKELNTDYRKKPTSTDVLSFYYGEPHLFGELYISLDDVSQNAATYSEGDTARELVEMIIHGTLHVLGHKHSSKMFAIQRKYARLWYESHRRIGKSRS